MDTPRHERFRARRVSTLDDSSVIWAREIPDLDPLTEGIVERIHILAHDFNESMPQTLAEFDLDRRAFKLLGRLRSVGAAVPALGRDAGQRPAALDRRDDQPARPAGERPAWSAACPTRATGAARWWSRPRRATPPGIETVGTQARREAMIASVLRTREREQLHRLLRRLMRAFPDKGHARKSHGTTDADPPAGAGPRTDGHG